MQNLRRGVIRCDGITFVVSALKSMCLLFEILNKLNFYFERKAHLEAGCAL